MLKIDDGIIQDDKGNCVDIIQSVYNIDKRIENLREDLKDLHEEIHEVKYLPIIKDAYAKEEAKKRKAQMEDSFNKIVDDVRIFFQNCPKDLRKEFRDKITYYGMV